jgi:hypothetical protein
MSPTPPRARLRWDRLLLALLVVGGGGFALYWFALK